MRVGQHSHADVLCCRLGAAAAMVAPQANENPAGNA